MKILLGISHADHGLTSAQIAHIEARFADRDAFFIETFELPDELGTVMCGLHGPVTGDEPIADELCVLKPRGERTWPSRLCALAPRPTRTVTVIAGPVTADAETGTPAHPCVLYTAFGGPLAPKEPGDPTLQGEGRIEVSRSFWAQHALSR